ncbi:hypothetical protein CSW98_15435 [Vibrio sp. HA2012]|uniref:O-antigen ligase family protein n=1 Tax=Vibrio sp. HA2012 TaxID=1971595 RepID=UPI000C2CAF5C|nr:O-antigen ligase family protein [Vibrio sp. HA2012]PJC85229.1 hypothetical protein CSW98_15435 [Vibrio sp. HA2012]
MNSKLYDIFYSKKYYTLVMFSLCTYALTLISFEKISHISHIMFLLLSIPILFIEKKKIFKDPMVILLGIVLVVQLISWLNATFHYPEFAESSPKLDRLAKLFLFIFIAYWLKAKTKNIYLLLGCFLSGVILGVLTSPDFVNELSRGLQGYRVDFSVKNAQFTAMFSAVGIIICAFFAYQVISSKSDKKTLLISGLCLTALFLIVITAAAQARQTWVALIVSLLSLPFFTKIAFGRIDTKKVIIFYIVLGIVMFSGFSSDIVKKRFIAASSVAEQILKGEVDNLPMTSAGIRVNSWLEASGWIKENPIVGASPEAISQVLLRSEKFQSSPNTKGFRHLHNYHIETLVAYGLLGLLSIYAMYGWLIKSLIQIKQQLPESRPFLLLATVFCCFWFIINCFETFNARAYGVFTHNIILGCCYTFYLTHSLQSKKKE